MKKGKRTEGKAGTRAGNSSLWPNVNGTKPDSAIEKRIAMLLSTMSLDRKIGQMVQIEAKSFTPEEMKKYRFGSVLNGGGGWPHGKKDAEINEWVSLADSIWKACREGMKNPIPPMWGTDAVHGHNNVMGATLFPHNIGLGAANDANLMYRIGQVTAKEVAATGLDWNFAPTVAVVQDDRWGRTYESYSEMPEIVASCAAGIISGMQGRFGDENILATAKHFLGDGGTDNGDDRGNNSASEEELIKIHAPGYFAAIKAGVQVIMASYSRWRGKRMHEHAYLLTDILKSKMGFDGFVVSDWNAVGDIDGCTKSSCPQAVNAGIDMFMIPFKEDWTLFVANLKSQVETGAVPIGRVDDAVSRILRVKVRMGLFEKAAPAKRTLAGKSGIVGAPEHRALAREAVRKSLVLLKNNNTILPLDPASRVLVAGSGADSIPLQVGGWSLTWQGDNTTNRDFKNATSILNGIKAVAKNVYHDPTGESADSAKHDVAVVVIGENPYAEFRGDIEGGLTLEHAETHPEDIALLERIKKAKVPIVTVFLSGRPLCVNKELNCSEAFVAAWLPGSEGAGVADMLFASKDGTMRYDFTGKLSFSWPKKPCQTTVNFNDKAYDPLFPLGYGLTCKSKNATVNKLPEYGADGYGCNTIKLKTLTGNNVVAVFNGRFNGTNRPWMGGPGNWSGKPGFPDSSLPNMAVRVADDKLHNKGSAVRLQFKGPAYWGLGGKEQDLSGYYVSDYSLVFDVCVKAKPEGNVTVVVLCNYPCQDRVDISDRLRNMTIEKWEEVRIPLRKFMAANFLKITSKFQIETTGAADLLFANVRWEK
ncbi:MAG: glycoside hydrolase family 3 C-terminal domain-containing protein [Chitinispirillaceae bacterium]|nr:glycoside hydrolase family 3 C-terminal domain-containing protein [Chitinispirillaceae bacterium]